MRRSAAVYIGWVSVCALAALAGVYGLDPHRPSDVVGLALLSGLALVAEVLPYFLPRAARQSIAFYPYLAMVLIAPSWPSVVAVLVVKAIMEFTRDVAAIKALFNVAQHVLAVAAAVVVYRALGGVSLTLISPKTLVHMTTVAGAPAMAAVISAYLTNSILVTFALALINQTSARSVWTDIKGPIFGLDVLAGPLVFLFAWVFAAFGPIAAAAAWMPFLGLRQAYKTNLELEQTNQELLELMVKSLEARDPYTSGHSRRVQQVSIIIARALGLSQKEVERVGRAALLHDVGKIHEKYAVILGKPDTLTADEWITMKEHPGDGASLIATMSKLREIVPAVRHHHENWDGTGYPDNLSGELIPLASRIIRFADTIDAMTSERPYRRPLTEPAVRAELLRCRGTQFDPQIMDRLLASPHWMSMFAPALSVSDQFAIVAMIGPNGARDRVTASARGA